MAIVVPGEKIVDYLLSPAKSKGKSGFFFMFGYTLEDWPRLRDDIYRIGSDFPKTLKRETAFGNKYEIVGEVVAPNGRKIKVKTGWLAAHEDPDILRFITAYPVS
jgi:hypothetical protein